MAKVKDVYELFDDVYFIVVMNPEGDLYSTEEWEENLPEGTIVLSDEAFKKKFFEREIDFISAWPIEDANDFAGIHISCK